MMVRLEENTMTKRDQIVAGKFLAAAALTGVALAIPQAAEASCIDQYGSDINDCTNARSACLNDPDYSFWTGTCNLQYLNCATGAELWFGGCILSS
jgi:hypothetical protein